MPVDTKTVDAAVLEIERFEWVTPERIEIVGYWSGLRGRRFMRPTLVLKGESEPKRLLATLEHKPWSADEGEEWIAAFTWQGDVVRFDSAEMNVGSGIDLELPPPRMRPGKPRRFRQRVVARDASRDAARAQDAPKRPSGIVSDAPEVVEEEAEPTQALTGQPEPTQALTAEPAPEPEEDRQSDEAVAARAEADRLRKQRDELRRGRDEALEKLRTIRGELEGERQSREKAVADARADEREKANRMLSEGGELRAAVERQREIAYLERDQATKARDEAVAARDKACRERDAALTEAKEAKHQRKEAFAERDRAIRIRKQAEASRDEALVAREEAFDERDHAVRERDEILSVHERGLPVKQPKPRFLPEDHEQRSDLEVWGPRASALGVLLLCAFIVLRLFACG
jgi:hypothetical protein